MVIFRLFAGRLARWFAVFGTLLFIAHVTVFSWQLFDPGYLPRAKWLTEYVLVPLHKWVISIVGFLMPVLKTLVGNRVPTHAEVPHLLYPLIMLVEVLVLTALAAPFKTSRETSSGVLAWAVQRIILFAPAFVVAHVAVLLWQATSEGYKWWAEVVADYILIPLHPWLVAFVASIAPSFKTIAGNLEPSQAHAPRVFYPLIMGIVYAVGAGIVYLFRTPRREPPKREERKPPRRRK